MRTRLERIMAQYGQTVTLSPGNDGDAREIRAFLQPVLKKQEEPQVAITPLGPVSEQRWLYIGPANTEAAVGDRMACGEARLVVQEARPVYWRDEVLYRWAILRREKEAAV